ncbi:MAG: hypothetical protein DRJ40_02140 [Thermoprotei archaeon]|nr:MAG: hypothetical protein DRJ40_02140 [Thermoprotei archaeon]
MTSFRGQVLLLAALILASLLLAAYSLLARVQYPVIILRDLPVGQVITVVRSAVADSSELSYDALDRQLRIYVSALRRVAHIYGLDPRLQHLNYTLYLSRSTNYFNITVVTNLPLVVNLYYNCVEVGYGVTEFIEYRKFLITYVHRYLVPSTQVIIFPILRDRLGVAHLEYLGNGTWILYISLTYSNYTLSDEYGIKLEVLST